MSLYYDRQGRMICQECWSTLHNTKEYRQLVFTDIEPDVSVSTVWLGIDHNWMLGPPHIFETMVFGGEYNDECHRYSTEAEALAGHSQVVAKVRASKNVLRG